MSETTSKKRKLSLPLIVAGGVSSLVLALGMSPTFSAFTAAINNATNSAGAGTLSMEETLIVNGSASTLCDSVTTGTLSCTIDKFGANLTMSPGQTVTTTVTVKNTGSMPATSFSMKAFLCTPNNVTGASVHGADDPCTLMTVVVTAKLNATPTTTVVGLTTTTLAAFGGITSTTYPLPGPVASNDTVTMVFAVTLPAGAPNTVQGRMASMPITFTFGQ